MNTPIVISTSIEFDQQKKAFECAVIGALVESGYEITTIPELYHLPEDSDLCSEISNSGRSVILLSWLYPRPAGLVAKRLGIDCAAVLDMDAFESPEDCVAEVRKMAEPSSQGALTEIPARVVARWYPVLDTPRCVNCGHCLQFCLFNVYTTNAEGAVSVTNPDNCKPGCPACSRVCPESAIIFPLYRKDEAIAGAPGKLVCVAEEDRPRRTPPPQPAQAGDAQDDIDILVNDLENITKRRP